MSALSIDYAEVSVWNTADSIENFHSDIAPDFPA